MNTKELITPAQASKITGLTTQTLRLYAEKGVLHPVRNNGKSRKYYKHEILELAGLNEPEKTPKWAYYTRSSNGDTKLIDTQITALKEAYGQEPDYIITDKASGLSEKRRGLKRLIKLAQDGSITDIGITNKDRLTRFGYSYLEALFEQNNVTLHVLGDKETKSLYDELLEDFMSLIASFSGKFYRLRGYENQKKLIQLAHDEVSKKEESLRERES